MAISGQWTKSIRPQIDEHLSLEIMATARHSPLSNALPMEQCNGDRTFALHWEMLILIDSLTIHQIGLFKLCPLVHRHTGPLVWYINEVGGGGEIQVNKESRFKVWTNRKCNLAWFNRKIWQKWQEQVPCQSELRNGARVSWETQTSQSIAQMNVEAKEKSFSCTTRLGFAEFIKRVKSTCFKYLWLWLSSKSEMK